MKHKWNSEESIVDHNFVSSTSLQDGSTGTLISRSISVEAMLNISHIVVHDNEYALVNKPKRQKSNPKKKLGRSCSVDLVDPVVFIDHIEVQGDQYAVVNKVAPKLNKITRKSTKENKKEKVDASTLISPTLNAQLSPISTRQIKNKVQGGNLDSTRQIQTAPVISKGSTFSGANLLVSPSTQRRTQNILDMKEKHVQGDSLNEYKSDASDKELVEKKRHNRPAPATPAKYVGDLPKKIISDSLFLLLDGSTSYGGDKTVANRNKSGLECPIEPRLDECKGSLDEEDPPYVNVRRNERGMYTPTVFPRQEVAAISIKK